jgi:fatty-acyl-CoA synthase
MNTLHYPFWPKRRPFTMPVVDTNLADNLRVTASRFPDVPAIVFYDSPITYARLWSEVEALAGWLQQRAGVKRGDRVLLDMQNSPSFIIAYQAIARADAVIVPINPMNVTEEVALLLADSGATVAICGQELFPRLAPLLGNPLTHCIVASYSDYVVGETALDLPPAVAAPRADLAAAGDRVAAFSDAVAAQLTPGPMTAHGEDMLAILYTSGTTGKPKGCVHTHRTVQTTCWATPHWFGVGMPGNRILSVLPYFHVTGMTGDMNAGLLCGVTNVMMTRWDPVTALTLIERYAVTGLSAISTMIVDLLSHPQYRSDALRSLTGIAGGGAPLPAAVGRELSERLGLTYTEGYGLTETIAMTHANPPDNAKLQCAGIPTFGVDSRIIDPTSLQELKLGETGEIVTHGNQVMREYWNQPDATAESFVEIDGKQFFRTGDLGYIDPDGYFFITDRVKRMINASGFKVWPAEVETKLFDHPAVKEACVIASIDPRRGETVKAVVVLREGATATGADIIDWARGHMAAYKVPHAVEFVDALPRGATGKVAWRQLQEDDARRSAEAIRQAGKSVSAVL